MSSRLGSWLFALSILGLLVAGCGPTALDAGTPSPPPAAAGPTVVPTQPPPLQLAVLHTNDNWGETEPCG